MFGDRFKHDRLIRQLAIGAQAAVVFPEYLRSPGVRYPAAIGECWTLAQWVRGHGAAYGLDGSRIAVVGDGAGGNIGIALTFLAKGSRRVDFAAQALFYPVTNAGFDTPSYRQFGEGFYLRRDCMQWLWHHYLGGQDARARTAPHRSAPRRDSSRAC